MSRAFSTGRAHILYVDVPNSYKHKLFKWLFTRVLAYHQRSPGSIPGWYMSVLAPGTSSLEWRRPWSSLFISRYILAAGIAL
jgi:hypothetical protein